MRSEGLEPPTYKFVACCSIQLSYDRTLRVASATSQGTPQPHVPCRERSEREGFEPSIRCYPYNGLANRRLQPLGHLSAATSASTRGMGRSRRRYSHPGKSLHRCRDNTRTRICRCGRRSLALVIFRSGSCWGSCWLSPCSVQNRASRARRRRLPAASPRRTICWSTCSYAEIGATGYVLTGEPSFLVPYRASRTRFPARHRRFARGRPALTVARRRRAAARSARPAGGGDSRRPGRGRAERAAGPRAGAGIRRRGHARHGCLSRREIPLRRFAACLPHDGTERSRTPARRNARPADPDRHRRLAGHDRLGVRQRAGTSCSGLERVTEHALAYGQGVGRPGVRTASRATTRSRHSTPR